ncbi:MAG: serine hydrolase, partial [Clostridia bacterium]|nr:serine hydrolase [Clostridia bacterium]
MEKLAKQMFDLLVRYCVKKESNIAPYPFLPQKTAPFSARTPQSSLPRSTPEAQGISSSYLAEMLHRIEAEKSAAVHNVLVLRNGAIICDASAPGYSTATWCLTHSMAKSITALLIGILIDEGALSMNTRICDVLREECPERIHASMRSLTVWHLLSMSSGVSDISEFSSVVEPNWTRTFLSSSFAFESGTAFHYNSVNSYMLSVIACRITGKSLTELLTEKLFKPLGIRNFFAEVGPEGYEKGGWGMYVSPQDMAKLGLLLLGKGVYEGKRILSESFLREMTRTAFVTGESYGDYNYGLHTWIAKDKGSILFSGMLGQNLWVCPKNNVVVAITSGNGELFQKQVVLDIINTYLGKDFTAAKKSLPINKIARRAYERAQKEFYVQNRRAVPLPAPTSLAALWAKVRKKSATPLPNAANQYVGSYKIEKNNTGLLPLFVRFMQNNHSAGIDEISISIEGERFLITFAEGDQTLCFEAGFYENKLSELCFNGEYYQVSAVAELAKTAEGSSALFVELVFPELPNTRLLVFRLTESGMTLSMNETPGRAMIDALIQTHVPESLRGGGLAQFIRIKMFGADPLKSIAECAEPFLVG